MSQPFPSLQPLVGNDRLEYGVVVERGHGGEGKTNRRAGRTRAPTALVLLTQVLGVLSVVLSYRTQSPDHSSGLHSTLSTLSLYLVANGVLIYRVSGCWRRRVSEVWHICWQAMVLPSSVGVSLATGFAIAIAERHLLSLHSWLALVSTALLAIQVAVGVVTMRCSVPQRLRAEARPLHVFLGLAAVLSLCATAITGLAGLHNTSLITSEGLTAHLICSNLAGICSIIFSLLICYIILLT